MSIKSEIVDYCSDLINRIDIKCEQALSSLDQNNAEAIKIEEVRTLFINKIKQVESFNLERLTKETKFAFENKFCFLLQIEPLNQFVKCGNKIGILIVVNEFLNKQVTTCLRLKINRNYDEKRQNLDNHEDMLKLGLLYDIISSKISRNQDPIFDLTNVDEIELETFLIFDIGTDIDYKGLKSLNKFVNLSKIEKIEIQTYRFNFINSEIFSLFEGLVNLKVENSMIATLPDNCFLGFDRLKKLKITGVEDLERKCFQGFKHLKTLDLSGNTLSILEADTFKELKSLEKFDISRNRFSIIETDMFKHLINLKNLKLGRNPIEILENNCFNNLSNLIQLDLYNVGREDNHEIIINETTFKSCPNLQILKLAGNRLANPERLQCLRNLKHLDLDWCALTEVDFLNNLKNLEYLDLRSNLIELEKIDKLNLPNLKYLLLRSAKLKIFGAGFKELQQLDVEAVVSIEPNSFVNFPKLGILRIQSTKWSNQVDFDKCEGLENLNFFSFICRPRRQANKQNFMDTNLALKLFFGSHSEPKLTVSDGDDYYFFITKKCESKKNFLESFWEAYECLSD